MTVTIMDTIIQRTEKVIVMLIKTNNKVVVTSDMIDVAVKSYIKRPSIRVASKASGIPEKELGLF